MNVAGRSPLFYRSLAALMIVAAAVARIVYLGWYCPLDLAPDEAHYWDWSRQLDWCYYSKGPLVALLIRGSVSLFAPLSLSLTGGEMLAVRLPAVMCGSLLLASVYVLTVQTFGRDRPAFFAVLAALTLPIVSAGSMLMTIDSPFLALWGWALVTAHAALFRERRGAWAATGVLLALGILAKHTMVLWLPFFGLFLLATPAFRPILWRRGFWVMTLVASLGAVPIFAWNATHGWVTLLHTQGHAGVTSPRTIHPTGPLMYFGTQFALLLGFWFVAWVRAAVRFRPLGETRPELRYLWFMSIPIVLFFGLFSLKNGGGEPNWPMAGYIAGMVLTAGWFAEQFAGKPRRALLASCIAFGLLGIAGSAVIHQPIAFQSLFAALAREPKPERAMPLRQVDPTCRLRGWQTLAAAVDLACVDLRTRDIEPVLAGTAWTHPGELAFYCAGHPAVYTFGPAIGDRHSQYDLWHPNPLADPGAFRGKTFIVIGADASVLSGAFEKTEPTRSVEHREGDHLIASWGLTVCHRYRGFPPPNGSQGW